MMRVAAQLNYRAAAAELKHQGIEVSHTTLHQKVQAWSSGESVSDYVAKESLDVGARWYVSCDGCQTNSPVGWREVKVGSIGKDYPHQNATSVMKIRPPSLRVCRLTERCGGFSTPTHSFSNADRHLSRRKNDRRRRSRCDRRWGTMDMELGR